MRRALVLASTVVVAAGPAQLSAEGGLEIRSVSPDPDHRTTNVVLHNSSDLAVTAYGIDYALRGSDGRCFSTGRQAHDLLTDSWIDPGSTIEVDVWVDSGSNPYPTTTFDVSFVIFSDGTVQGDLEPEADAFLGRRVARALEARRALAVLEQADDTSVASIASAFDRLGQMPSGSAATDPSSRLEAQQREATAFTVEQHRLDEQTSLEIARVRLRYLVEHFRQTLDLTSRSVPAEMLTAEASSSSR